MSGFADFTAVHFDRYKDEELIALANTYEDQLKDLDDKCDTIRQLLVHVVNEMIDRNIEHALGGLAA